jgi:putative nucleotidyltransferase with HDIG domain
LDYKKHLDQFLSYAKGFSSDDIDRQEFYDVKLNHSLRVSAEIHRLGRAMKLDHASLNFARIIGLYHDIGRFEQFKVYRTFNDEKSVDHSILGIQILKKNRFLNEFCETDREIIFRSIKNHNVYKIDSRLDDASLFYTKLLRDADKIDIYKLSIEDERVERMYPKDSGNYSINDQILESFRKHQNVRVEDAETLFDFILMRLSWIFDFNFPETITLIRKRDYFNNLLRMVPASARRDEIERIINEKIREIISLS